MKITRPTHTSSGGVGDLTTTAKKLIVKLVDNSNNNSKNILHDVDVNKCVKSHIAEQAKASSKHILSNLYNNIYNAPQPSSHADEPTMSIEKVLLNYT